MCPSCMAFVQVFSTPLVGVWVKGPSSPCHPLVAAACLKFCYSHVLLDRAVQRDASFLLLLCPEGGWAAHMLARGGWDCGSSYDLACTNRWLGEQGLPSWLQTHACVCYHPGRHTYRWSHCTHHTCNGMLVCDRDIIPALQASQ
jgi:hypothetical protein